MGTSEAKLRNQLSPIYNIADMLIAIEENPDKKDGLLKIAIDAAKQAIVNKQRIKELLLEIENKKIYVVETYYTDASGGLMKIMSSREAAIKYASDYNVGGLEAIEVFETTIDEPYSESKQIYHREK